MLRIHFTDADLARVRVATAPDPLWETVLGLHQLTTARAHAAFQPWRRRARAEVTGSRLGATARLLTSLAPPDAPYFPDFLTPAESSEGLAAGLAAVRATPAGRLQRELGLLAATTPQSGRPRAGGARPRVERLADRPQPGRIADALHAVYETIIAPDWARVATQVEADRSLRLRALRDGGTSGLLHSLRPTVTWRFPVLHATYPVDRDIHLRGRGLRLVPSRFCWRMPVALGDPDLPPVLVYPIDPGEAHEPEPPGGPPHAAALAALLGGTRARVLMALAATGTTGELAVRLGVSAASASKHARALREARLVASRRHGGTVLHTLTPLGAALLSGELPAPHRCGGVSRPAAVSATGVLGTRLATPAPRLPWTRQRPEGARRMSPHDPETPPARHPLPLADYDELPLGELESRIRPLERAEVQALLDHERTHAARTPAIEVLRARLGQLDAGERPTTGDASAAPRPGQPPGRHGSPVSPTTSPEPSGPPPHGTPDQRGRPKGNRV